MPVQAHSGSSKEKIYEFNHCICFSGHHARILCARHCGTQDPEWTEETGDRGKTNGK